MQKHAKLVPIISILIFYSFGLPCIKASVAYVDVTVSEAKNMMYTNHSLTILDVRTQGEYDSGHIRNAKLIPHTELEARLDELDKNRDTLVYCRSGYRSSIASEILTNHSFQKVYNMLGGILAWVDTGYTTYVRYSSIQRALNNASTGDSIFLSSGMYCEHVAVNKTVSLVGENPETTFIDGNGTQTVLEITSQNVNITRLTIQNGGKGIYLTSNADSGAVINNIVLNHSKGVFVESDSNLLNGNEILNCNLSGIEIFASCGCSPVYGNTVTENILLNNSCGIQLFHSQGNFIFHNNFVNNKQQVFAYDSGGHWDDGYPSGGNYWSDYKGRYLHAKELDDSGIWEHPYVIDEKNQDNYPLMETWSPQTDTIPPTITILSPENKTYTQTSIPFVSTLDESPSWIGYSVDGETNKTVPRNVTINNLPAGLFWINTTLKSISEGPHWMKIYANDTAGNMNSSHVIHFTVDVTPPTITSPTQVPETNVDFNQEVLVSVNVTDEISGINRVILSYTTTNSTSWNSSTMSYNSIIGLYEAVIPEQAAESLVKYKIIAYDNAGNLDVNDNAGQYYDYTVVPEFPSIIFLLLFLIATFLATTLMKFE